MKPKLLDQVRDKIRYKHYSIRTEEAYIGWIKRFIFYHKKQHPINMGEAEVCQFLTDLAVNKKVAASTQNQALCAIVFLYREVIQKKLGEFKNLSYAKKPAKLPVVFTQSEVKSVLVQLKDDKWLMGQFLYGSGLRLMECLRLRVKDIDFEYKQITVRDGKGNKDRVTMLPNIIFNELKRHLEKKVNTFIKRIWLMDLVLHFYLMLSKENTQMLIDFGAGNMFFLLTNVLLILEVAWKEDTISMKVLYKKQSKQLFITPLLQK